MNRWNVEHHTGSGLLDRVRNQGVARLEAEALTLEFLDKHTFKRRTHLCGNSVWQDRRFLRRYMPLLDDWFHYRLIDVSSIKEIVKRWHPGVLKEIKKNTEHRALADIRESIEELRFYRKKVLHDRGLKGRAPFGLAVLGERPVYVLANKRACGCASSVERFDNILARRRVAKRYGKIALPLFKIDAPDRHAPCAIKKGGFVPFKELQEIGVIEPMPRTKIRLP